MRTSNLIMAVGLLGMAFGFSPAVSFDGTRTPEGTTVAVPQPDAGGPNVGGLPLGSATPLAAVPNAPVAPTTLPPAGMPPPAAMPPSPQEALRSATQALRQGRTDQALMELEYAAEQDVPGALWKLGRMYADGDGVKTNKARAYEYFRRLTRRTGNSLDSPNARFVAKGFVALGLYHLKGIPGVLEADAGVAVEMFREAASYYRDPEAQYHLGQLYLEGKGAPKDSVTAARWLALAANNGEHRAQAVLGGMLFSGDQVSRQAARGLFWLTVAREAASPSETWITEMHAGALARASDNEKAMAHKYLLEWLKKSRE
jgi:uncharacterized protein